ncbi:MAG TPA: hypothetical protein VGP07_13005 [Polyangia bacterium]
MAVCALLVATSVFRPSGVSSPARAQSAPGASGYRIIVHPANSISSVDRAFVAQAFLKKIQQWPDGEAIQPVDLEQNSAVRRQWSGDMLSRSVAAVKSYWQQMIFSGRNLPPPELGSDKDVVSYVLRKPGGIGYVSAAVELRGAKILMVK